jgi:hypothetical protein
MQPRTGHGYFMNGVKIGLDYLFAVIRGSGGEMSHRQTRGCYPEDSQADGCFPEPADLPSRLVCWIEGTPDRNGRAAEADTSPKRLLRYLTGERG